MKRHLEVLSWFHSILKYFITLIHIVYLRWIADLKQYLILGFFRYLMTTRIGIGWRRFLLIGFGQRLDQDLQGRRCFHFLVFALFLFYLLSNVIQCYFQLCWNYQIDFLLNFVNFLKVKMAFFLTLKFGP